MTLNSSFNILTQSEIAAPLLTSSPVNTSAGHWIQPSISSQAYPANYVIIQGIYAQVKPSHVIPLSECELELELAAWDMASDEALSVFEAQFD